VRAGGRLSVYVSQALAADLELLRGCYPGARNNDIVRRALVHLVDRVRHEKRTECARAEAGRLANERLWN
jgi:hypothetical protein